MNSSGATSVLCEHGSKGRLKNSNLLAQSNVGQTPASRSSFYENIKTHSAERGMKASELTEIQAVVFTGL